MDGQHLPPDTRPPLKIHDPTGPDWPTVPPAEPEAVEQSGAVAIFSQIIAAIIALAATVAALGVLALACKFLRWSLID